MFGKTKKTAQPGVYELPLRLRSDDVDVSKRLRLDVMFSLFQQVAIAHTEALGAGRRKTLYKGLLWVVIKQQAEISRMPEYDEELTLRSWPGNTMHIMFPRYYELVSASGEILVRASSLWVLMDSKTRSFAFPEKHGVKVPGTVTGREIELPSGIAMPELPETAQLSVSYSRCDLNGHLNNTRYFDVVCDLLPTQLVTGRCPAKVCAEYSKEIRMGEDFSVSYGENGGVWSFQGQTDSQCFRISLSY